MAQKASKTEVKKTFLDQTFWQNFAQKYWEKKPLILKNVKSDLLEIGDGEIFNLLVLYSDRCRKAKDPEGFKFYIDGFKMGPEDVLQILPQKKDKSLLGYHARMQAEFSDYCLVCDELLKVNVKKQDLLTDFTDELYRHVGFPNRFSEMGLYLGNYRKTPFGVHVDSCGVFSFPVAGSKRFRLWPAGYGDKHPALDRAFRYDKYKKDSVVIKAGPGDMVYWPSSAWHIAESDGSFSATWSLGVWVDQPHQTMISESLNTLLEKKLGVGGQAVTTSFKKLHSLTGEVKDLPAPYAESLKVLRALTERELKETLLKSWMRHISMQGFKTIPHRELKVSSQSLLKLRSPKSMILWQQSLTEKEKFYFCFAGVLVEGAKGSGMLELIQAVNAGEIVAVGRFLKGAKHRKHLLALQSLANTGAFA